MLRSPHLIVTWLLAILALPFSQVASAQSEVEMVYPDIILHYPKAPEALRGRVFVAQEWRRDLNTNKLSKGNRYVINEQGLLDQLDIVDPVLSETWSYEYDAARYPTHIEITLANGDRYEHVYTYHDDYYVLEGYRPEGRTQRMVYFLDDDGHTVEKKTYRANQAGGELHLTKRIVFTYKDGLKTGEMHYNYFQDNERKAKVQQIKKLFFYDAESSLLLREQSFLSISYGASDKPKSSGDFKIVDEQVDYIYNPTTWDLLTKLKSIGPPLRLEQKWNYTYRDGRLERSYWEKYDPSGKVIASSETTYNEYGGVKGFEHQENGLKSIAYRSSFVVEF